MVFGLNSNEIQEKGKKLDQLGKLIRDKMKKGESEEVYVEEYKKTLIEMNREWDKMYGKLTTPQLLAGGSQIAGIKERIKNELAYIEDKYPNLK